jgi:hypothetical protein
MSEENLFASIDATMAEVASGNAETSNETAETVEVAETAAEARARDERGRFAAKAGEEAVETVEAVDDEIEQAEREEVPAVAAKHAPGSWPKEVREHFNALPEAVQDYVVKREAEVSRVINQYSQKAKQYDQLAGTLAPYEPILRADGLEPTGVINGLMQTYQTLRNAAPHLKAQAVAQMIQQFGVDLSLISEDGQQSGNSAYDPAVYDKLNRLEQQLLQRQHAEEQAAQREVMTTIEQFKANAPHFDAVQAHMGALLANGAAKDMQDAYDQACWASPEVRATLLAQQEAKRRETAAAAVAAAKKASVVNIPTRGTLPPSAPTGSMEDTMRDVLRRMNS